MSGPSRHLYSAVIDVSQTSVTLSGGTQSAPTLSPASLFMSPPFIWQSKVYEPPRLFYPLRGPRDKGRRCTQRPPLYLQERVMLIQRQPGPLQHMDGRLPAWLGHGHWGPGRRGPGESPLTQRKGGPSLSGSERGSLDDTEATAGPSPPRTAVVSSGEGARPRTPKSWSSAGPHTGRDCPRDLEDGSPHPHPPSRAAAPPVPSRGVPGWAGPAPQGERGWGADQLKSKPPLPAPPRRAPAEPPRTSSFVTMFFNPVKQTVQLEPGPPASIFADV
ncbi:unnamed protein product [Rangifer tarandus platyrhynchus]|uniref:Uncharacterized protein n=1 Tax=Rangifer tarandus platyrhynchus TaxID=3082113 RepID=A0AC59YHZ2_RANTA